MEDDIAPVGKRFPLPDARAKQFRGKE